MRLARAACYLVGGNVRRGSGTRERNPCRGGEGNAPPAAAAPLSAHGKADLPTPLRAARRRRAALCRSWLLSSVTFVFVQISEFVWHRFARRIEHLLHF